MLNDPFRNLKLPDDVISKLLDRGPKICHICACLLNPENAVARRPSSDSDIEADNRLRRTLSSFRREAAEGKPAYFVFNNRSIDRFTATKCNNMFKKTTGITESLNSGADLYHFISFYSWEPII